MNKATPGVPLFWLLVALSLCEMCQCVENSAKESTASNILVLIPFDTKSHKNMFVPLIKALAQRGHQLDVISMFTSSELQSYSNVNETVIELGPDAPLLSQCFDASIFSASSSTFFGFLKSFDYFVQQCEHMMSLPLVRDLYKRVASGHYKVVLFDAFFCECFLPLAHMANAPIIQVAPSHLMPWNYAVIGASVNYAQDAVFFLPHGDRKTLTERALAAVMGASAHVYRDTVYLPRIQRIVQKTAVEVLGKQAAASIPPVGQIESKRTALVLVNWHWSFGSFVRSNPPNIVEVATMHCNEPQKVDKDLNDFIEKSRDAGFILFSLGSTIKGNSMPLSMQKIFIKAFSELPQRVLWKFERPMEELQVPENVMVRPWLPQQDLLGDPRLRLFITQAGMLSLQEAAWHGAPVLLTPLIVDQKANAAVATAAGIGLKLELHSATAQSVRDLINQVISNHSFAENARRLSQQLRDQPESARERAVWWVEYAIRHNGTDHLRQPTADLHWTQSHLLDVAILVAAAAWVLFLAATAACRSTRSRCKRKIE